MPIHVAVRVSYPERGNYNWYEALAAYAEVGCVEVAFYHSEPFLQEVTVEKVLAPFARLPLRATSVHMAQARIAEPDAFAKVLRKTISIAQALGCSLIVAHPTNARLEEIEAVIATVIDPLLARAGVTLCWETFGGRRRFLSGIEGIAAFCAQPMKPMGQMGGYRRNLSASSADSARLRRREHHAACYDTAHLHKPQVELLADIAAYAWLIGCFHLSNRSADSRRQHLPLRHPEGVLDFEEIVAAIVRSGFEGPLTLEYLPAYHEKLVPDALWLQEVLNSLGP